MAKKTTDAGVSWTGMVADSLGGFLSVRFSDSLRGWLFGGEDLFDNFDKGLVLNTEDGGVTWNKQTIPSVGPIGEVTLIGSEEIWAGGSSGSMMTSLIHTLDGGAHWETVPFQIGPTLSTNQVLGLSALASGLVYVVFDSYVYESPDRGQSWTRISPTTSGFVLSVFAYDSLHVWLCGSSGRVWKRVCPTSVKVAEGNSPIEFEVATYPNPSNGTVNISLDMSSAQEVSIDLVSMQGRRVLSFTKSLQVGSNVVTLSTEALSSGSYLLVVANAHEVRSKKLILLK